MLGLGTDYLDEYLFRGGSQFAYAAKGYEFAGYSADAIVEEGGYILPKYRAMKTNALFLRQFGSTIARAEAAAEPATVDDPEVWIKQRNKGDQGLLFVRSDMRGVSDLTLALKSVSQQHITYHDPKSGRGVGNPAIFDFIAAQGTDASLGSEFAGKGSNHVGLLHRRLVGPLRLPETAPGWCSMAIRARKGKRHSHLPRSLPT